MSQINITVSVPHQSRDFSVKVPSKATGKQLYNALMKRANLTENSNDVYHLFDKRISKKIYPDLAEQNLEQIGVKEGHTILMKKDMDPGATADK